MVRETLTVRVTYWPKRWGRVMLTGLERPKQKHLVIVKRMGKERHWPKRWVKEMPMVTKMH